MDKALLLQVFWVATMKLEHLNFGSFPTIPTSVRFDH